MLDNNQIAQIPFIETDLVPLKNETKNEILDQSEVLVNSAVQYKEFMTMYSCAIKEVQTKLEVLNAEYSVRYQRNPINFINHRLKKTASIVEKLNKLGLPFTLEAIEDNLNDVAGIRVICSFIDDIYAIAKALVNQDDVELIQEKDYISHPKKNGYRSLHLIITVPVFFSDHVKKVRVEVQIRTIAMDFWASVEHQLKYKQHVKNEDVIIERLKQCADVIAATDNEMLDIRNEIALEGTAPTKEESMMANLKRIDIDIP